jgi:hypothetical protein
VGSISTNLFEVVLLDFLFVVPEAMWPKLSEAMGQPPGRDRQCRQVYRHVFAGLLCASRWK